ncbi:MAG: hypothetical protein ACYCO3_02770 [Mycobacteriales bacterium]
MSEATGQGAASGADLRRELAESALLFLLAIVVTVGVAGLASLL